jgi:aldehyde dehydrogenase (NAD+)
MSDTLRSTNPFDPSDVVAEVAMATEHQIDSMLESAAAAQTRWAEDAMLRSRSLTALGEAVAARRQEFVELMVREVGKPVAEAEGELERALAILRYYSQAALDPDGETLPGSTPGARVVVRREALGVVLAICPWNFPLAIPLWKAAPAMAWGNAVVIKPAGPAVATAALLEGCAEEALPPGVMSCVLVPGSRISPLLDDERIAAVTFTGSTGVGVSVAERMARRAAPAQAEMGGQNPAIVLEDANLDAAAGAIVAGAMGYAGQKCTATRRVVALAGIADELEHKVAELVAALEVGDPREPGITVGPLISAGAVEEFEAAVEAGIADGATRTAAAAAAPPAGTSAGHFATPTLLRQDDPLATASPLPTRRASVWSARSTAETSAARARSPHGSTAAFAASTPRHPASTTTRLSAGKASPASVRASRAAPPASSSPPRPRPPSSPANLDRRQACPHLPTAGQATRDCGQSSSSPRRTISGVIGSEPAGARMKGSVPEISGLDAASPRLARSENASVSNRSPGLLFAIEAIGHPGSSSVSRSAMA